MTVAEWDAVWQRFYDRGIALGMSPNASVHRADDLMLERHGERPCVDARVRAARSE